VKSALGERVSDVRASQRLTDSPAAWSAKAHGPDRELERLLARQKRGARRKPILELNMRHPLVRALSAANAALPGRRDATWRCCCSTRRRSSTARCRTTRRNLRRGLNRLVGRGLSRSD
jgi:HSP90 family molecular chaperone